MCRIRCEVKEALSPRERAGVIKGIDGLEEVTASASLFEGDTIRVAMIAREDGRVLIELPRESASGHWRMWVAEDQLCVDALAGA